MLLGVQAKGRRLVEQILFRLGGRVGGRAGAWAIRQASAERMDGRAGERAGGRAGRSAGTFLYTISGFRSKFVIIARAYGLKLKS